MKHILSFSSRAVMSLCALAGICCMFSRNALAAQAPLPAQDYEVWLAESDRTLDQMRGGFDIGGLMVSFGIARVVYINGSLVVSTSFNIGDLSKITPQQAALINQQVGTLNLVQNGPGNTFQPGPSSSASLNSALASSASLGTIIQNTLNNQHIQSQTVINASTNGLAMLRGLNTLGTLNGVLANALGTR